MLIFFARDSHLHNDVSNGWNKIRQEALASVGNEICDYNGVAVDLSNVHKNIGSDEEYVLVTGGAGFIGSSVAEITASLDPNTTVIIIDDLSGGFLSNIPGNKNIIFEQGSLLNESFVDAIFQKYDRIKWIYHLAAYAAVGLSHHIAVYNYDNNQMASIRLINAAINYNVSQFIFTSSINIYGSGPYKGFEGKFTEEMHGYPQDPYGVSKYSIEYHLEIVRNYYGLNYTIFRPHGVYGPNQNIFDRYRNVIGIFMYSLLNSEPMKIFGDGKQTRSFSYIEDVAPYIALSPFYPHLLNKKFNVGSHQTTTLNELASAIIGVFIFENELINEFPNVQSLMIFKEYRKIRHNCKNREEIINHLLNNDRIVQHITQRNEVINAEASHAYFNCMFKVNVSQITELEIGLNKTLNWVVTNDRLKDFHQIRFDSIEVSKHLPPSWRDPNRPIKISPRAHIHNSKCDKKLAVLISGQLQRFIYKDQFGALIQNKADVDSDCTWTVDVFIALHNGTMAHPWSGKLETIPYFSNVTTFDIQHWYETRGASQVRVKIVNESWMKTMSQTVEKWVLKHADMNASDALHLISQHRGDRWDRYLRMLYLRHLAFTLSLHSNTNYDMLTYWREDNYFLVPLDVRSLFAHFTGNMAVIGVDQYCGWGALSDKIYLLNSAGGKQFFDVTFQDFKQKMADWVIFASHRTGDIFQTEAFLTHVMHSRSIKYFKFDLHRTEMRYVNGKLCASPGYIECTPALRTTHKHLVC